MIALTRTAIVMLALASAVVGGFWYVQYDEKQQRILELETLTADLQRRVEAREAMIERLGRSQRIAHLKVVDQRETADGLAETEILFIELDDDGAELARQSMVLPGTIVYVDAWTVKFRHEAVALGDPMRGRTLMLLRRIYSDRLPPADGIEIDTPGAVPPAYAVGDLAEFQRRLWAHFWEVATDAELADSMGVRVAQGEAVYKPMRKGQTYELLVDAAGGINLMPLPDGGPAGPDAIPGDPARDAVTPVG